MGVFSALDVHGALDTGFKDVGQVIGPISFYISVESSFTVLQFLSFNVMELRVYI